MRILTVMGSPHSQGNTATVLGWVENDLRQSGHEITRVNVAEKAITGCRACLSCKRVLDAPGCIIQDDGEQVLEQILASELLLLASPLYCWGFTAQLKALMDRCVCLKKTIDGENISLLSGRKLALLMTAAGPYENNLQFIEPVFANISWFLGTTIAGKLLLPGSTMPGEYGDRTREQAREFAGTISSA